MKGLVIRNTGSWYTVLADDGRLYECKVKGTFRIRLSSLRPTNPVAVGDRVGIQLLSAATTAATPDDAPQTTADACGTTLPAATVPAYITTIEDRRNYIIRRSQNLSSRCHILAANVDQACLVVTAAHPEVATTFIDRFLATAEAYSVGVVLLFNKADILTPEERRRHDELIDIYSHIGYHCITMSALTAQGVDQLRPLLADRITLLAGNSGVGKSTLLNTLIPGLDIRTMPLSAAHDTGQHTTTFSTMYMLDATDTGHPTAVIDTPGVRGFGTLDFQPAEVSHYFPEIFRQAAHCRFHDCTHTHEPHCAVTQALSDGLIAPSRYTSYLSMLEDANPSKYRPPQ